MVRIRLHPQLPIGGLLIVLLPLARNPVPIRNELIDVATAAHSTSSASSAISHLMDSTTWIEMRNVDLRVTPTAVLHVRRLQGQVMSTGHAAPFLDDAKSFSIRITSGTVSLTGEDLSVLLNTYVFGYPGSPLKRLHVRIVGSQIVQTGVMHKGIDLPFEMTASLSLTPQGLVCIHPTRIRLFGINGAALLHAVGLHLNNLLDLRKAHGASVHGDDLYLDPAALTPPPAITGRLATIRIDGKTTERL